jgi:hypothetical protein
LQLPRNPCHAFRRRLDANVILTYCQKSSTLRVGFYSHFAGVPFTIRQEGESSPKKQGLLLSNTRLKNDEPSRYRGDFCGVE